MRNPYHHVTRRFFSPQWICERAELVSTRLRTSLVQEHQLLLESQAVTKENLFCRLSCLIDWEYLGFLRRAWLVFPEILLTPSTTNYSHSGHVLPLVSL